MLTEQQKLFCREYLTDFVATKAARRAGYAPKSLLNNSWRLLKNPEIAEYLGELIHERTVKQELSAERVLEEMRRLAFSDIKDYYKWSEKRKRYVLKALDELTVEQRSAIAKYEPGEGYTLYSKDSALDKLGKYFKLYTEIGTVVHNYVIMPTVKIGGKDHIMVVGKPKKLIR